VASRLFILVAVLAVAGATGVARADNPSLTGTVGTGDSFQLVLADASGNAVSHLGTGTYTLVVHDNSELHNFHLFGPGGVDVATTVDTTGVSTFTVTLVDGVYTFQCDPHSFSGMRGQFAVGTAVLAKPPVKLTASILGSKASLSGSSGLHAGKAGIVVTDRSLTDGFLLQGPGVSKRTGIGFTGKVTWTVALQAGKYTYGPAKSVKGRRNFTVSGS
jgi:plastocyanin